MCIAVSICRSSALCPSQTSYGVACQSQKDKHVHSCHCCAACPVQDELSQLRADRGYVLYLNTKDGILPNLLATSVKWKQIQEEDKSKLDKSLRVTLLLALLMEWGARLEKTLSDRALKAVAQQADWLTTADPAAWSYQSWDAARKEVITLPEAVPYPAQQLLEDLRKLTILIDRPGVIHRFHATRPMAETYQSEVLVFLLTLSQKRESAAATMQLMDRLAGCSAGRVIGLRLRTDRPTRQPLAVQLDKLIKQRQSWG